MNENSRQITKETLAADEQKMRQSKSYAHKVPRPFLSYRKSVSPLPPEITDFLQVEKALIEFLFNEASCRFVPSQRALKIASLTPKTGNGDVGLLFRDFRLSELRKILGRAEKSEAEDQDILSVLDKLSLAFKLKVINAEISKWTHFSDCSFCAEVGVCVSEIRQSSGWAVPKLFDVHLYLNEPLDLKSFLWGDRTIQNVTERVQKLRQRRDAFFKREFGWKDLGLESRLHREDVEDEARLKAAIIKLAEGKGEKPDEGKE